MKSMYYWLGKHVHAKYGTLVFACLFFLEILFVPVPVSALHVFYCLENRVKTFYYAAVATIMSGIEAFAGYILGTLIWNILGHNFVYKIVCPQTFDSFVSQYKKYQAAAVIIMSSIPFMPFKILTLTASFIKLPLFSFILFCMLGRGIKFYTLSFAIHLWGHHFKYYIDKYFYLFMFAFIGFFILIYKLF